MSNLNARRVDTPHKKVSSVLEPTHRNLQTPSPKNTSAAFCQSQPSPEQKYMPRGAVDIPGDYVYKAIRTEWCDWDNEYIKFWGNLRYDLLAVDDHLQRAMYNVSKICDTRQPEGRQFAAMRGTTTIQTVAMNDICSHIGILEHFILPIPAFVKIMTPLVLSRPPDYKYIYHLLHLFCSQYDKSLFNPVNKHDFHAIDTEAPNIEDLRPPSPVDTEYENAIFDLLAVTQMAFKDIKKALMKFFVSGKFAMIESGTMDSGDMSKREKYYYNELMKEIENVATRLNHQSLYSTILTLVPIHPGSSINYVSIFTKYSACLKKFNLEM
jgi:hypothetical protein